jgi:hypothetical protein
MRPLEIEQGVKILEKTCQLDNMNELLSGGKKE